MIDPGTLPEGLLLLPALSVASGLDLYLTLVVLFLSPLVGWLGAAPETLVSGASVPVLVVAGVLWALELALESRFTSSALWHAVQAVARPVAGSLVGASLFSSVGPAAAAAATGALLAWLTHTAKRGLDVRRWLEGRGTPARLLVATGEDAATLGLVVLALESPPIAGAAGIVLSVLLLVASRPLRVCARFGLALSVDRVRSLYSPGGWQTGEAVPRPARRAWDELEGGGLRGAETAAVGLPGVPAVCRGWLLLGGDRVAFAVPERTDARLVELDVPERVEVEGAFLGDRIRLVGGGDAESSPTLALSRRAPPGSEVAAEIRKRLSGPQPPDRGT